MYKKIFFFRQDRQLKKLNPDAIIYLEAAKSYTKMYTATETYLARITLLEALKLLPENKFLRVHRSFAVAAEHIDIVTRNGILLENIEFEVPVSKMFYEDFSKQFIILDSRDNVTRKKRIVNARDRKG